MPNDNSSTDLLAAYLGKKPVELLNNFYFKNKILGLIYSNSSSFITSITTNGTSGAATVTSGVLNIPQYSGGSSGVTSFNTRTGNVTPATNDYTISQIAGLGTGVATFLGTPSSANLATAVTGATGTGALVFGTAPTITLANGTGLPII